MIDIEKVCIELLWTNLTLEEALTIVLGYPVFHAADELTAEEFCLITIEVFECTACLRWHRVPDVWLDPDIGELCTGCSIRAMVKRHGRRAIEHSLRIAARLQLEKECRL
jgi:hypothetical protein